MNKKIIIVLGIVVLCILAGILFMGRTNVSDELDEYKSNAHINKGPLSSFSELHSSDKELEQEITGNVIVDNAIVELCEQNDFKSFVVDKSWVDVNFGCTYYHVIFDDNTLYILCYDPNANAVGVEAGDYDDYID